MPAIVEFPQLMREAMTVFADLFACEPRRRHFAEHLTGLMVAANKTVTGIAVGRPPEVAPRRQAAILRHLHVAQSESEP